MTPLAGRRILLTRPEARAAGLIERLRAAGAEPASLPLLALDPLPLEPAVLEQARTAAYWIFTSLTAVEQALARIERPWPSCLAVGPATAAALRAAGLTVAAADQGAGSEALLALPPLTAPQGLRLALITGEGGRGLIETELAARGAELQRLALYRRRPLSHGEDRLASELALAEAVVISSGEGLEQLWSQTPPAWREELCRLPLVAPAGRVVERALALGFAQVQPVDSPGDEPTLAALRALFTTPQAAMSEPAAPSVTEAPSPAPAAPAPPGAPTRRRGLLALLLLLGAGGLLALGWGLYQAQGRIEDQQQALRRLQQSLETVAAESARTTTLQADLSRVSQRNGTDIASLLGRFDATEQLMGRINEELAGGRTRFQLAAVEHLLILANDRLQLEGDAGAALRALERADERLAALDDPRLFAVRQALSAERAALMALPRLDRTATALVLDSLIERAPRLPLRMSRPAAPSSAAGSATEPPPAADRPWWSRGLSQLAEALRSVFVLRRDESAASQRLLPPEQEALVVQLLQLRLEGARVAFLQRDEVAFRAQLRAALQSLDEQFRPDDPGVLALRAELERLLPLVLAPPLPDISNSLSLLRAGLEPAPR